MNNRKKQETFYGIGIGPGDPELLTLKAVRLLEQCPVIACPQTAGEKTLALDIVRQAVSFEGKTVLPLSFSMSREKEVREKSHMQAAELILSELAAGRDVAMIILGDVSIYSTCAYLQPLIQAAGYRTQMVPGVPSFCAVAAKLGQSLAEGKSPLHILPAGYDGWEDALSLPGTKVLMKAGRSLPGVAKALEERGLADSAALVQNCGLADELVRKDMTGGLPETGYFTTVVVREGKDNR